MAQYIVYYLDRSLIITDETIIQKNENDCFVHPEDITKFLFDFETDYKNKQAIFKTTNARKAWEILLKEYQVIEAAGGIVKNPKGEVLAIFRMGKWDLPKGKKEEGESPEETAYREIAEECGISGHKLLGEICETYHTYIMGKKKVLKRTHWYAFSIDNIAELIPQTIENIEEVRWIKPASLRRLLENSYHSIQHVFNEAQQFSNFL